jgi:DNA-binding GntR family transcriptional regulator
VFEIPDTGPVSSIPRLLVGESLADQAHRVLRELITTGAFTPGEGVTERGLADRLGVSPTPVREAIARLEHERLLVRRAFQNWRRWSLSGVLSAVWQLDWPHGMRPTAN